MVPAKLADRPRLVLFDLDGTLLDSAPDLAAAANRMRAARGLKALPLHRYRPMVGAGARGMLGVGFGIKPANAVYDTLKNEFLAQYASNLHGNTRPFEGITALLAGLSALGMPWGVVTNKAHWLTAPLIAQMPLFSACQVLICGDTTAHAKPHPAPVAEACRRMSTTPQQVIFVGDDPRDIQSGRAAGTQTAACTWGYLGANPDLASWQADHTLNHPSDLLSLLRAS